MAYPRSPDSYGAFSVNDSRELEIVGRLRKQLRNVDENTIPLIRFDPSMAIECSSAFLRFVLTGSVDDIVPMAIGSHEISIAQLDRIVGLRHTSATVLFAEGTHPKIVQERLGHATIGMKMDVYSHLLPSMQTEAAMTLD